MRPVRVLARRIAQHDLLPGRLPGGVVAPGRVLDGHREPLALLARARERRVGGLHDHVHLTADEAERVVGQQRARQEPGLAEHLEAVADAEHRAAVAANSITASISGEKRAIAPARR